MLVSTYARWKRALQIDIIPHPHPHPQSSSRLGPCVVTKDWNPIPCRPHCSMATSRSPIIPLIPQSALQRAGRGFDAPMKFSASLQCESRIGFRPNYFLPRREVKYCISCNSSHDWEGGRYEGSSLVQHLSRVLREAVGDDDVRRRRISKISSFPAGRSWV